MRGMGLFLWGQPRPHLNGVGSQRSSCGIPSIYTFILCCRTTEYDVVTHVGEWRVSWSQPRLQSQESGVLALPNFGILLYLCLHHLTQNDQIRHGNICGEGRVLGGQPRQFCICANASCSLSAIV